MGGGMMFFPCLILNTEVIYAVVTSALICYMHVFLAGLFAVMGIVHYKRMMMVLQSICRLTRPLFCVFPNLPQAQLSGRVGVENMRAVLACFEVTLRLGGRYQNRVEAYIATLASAATLGMSFIVVGVVIGVHNQMNSFTVVILSLNLGVTAIMFQMIWYGSKANENFGLLANNICRARWRNSVQKEDEDCEQVMSLAMERLAILCETEPVNIAGTVPTCDLGYSLLSVAGTIVAFVIGKLYNWDIPDLCYDFIISAEVVYLEESRTGPAVTRVIAHLDLDCFYVQVEQRRLGMGRPPWTSRDSPPAAVQQWDGLIAVNYAARAAGVKRGMRAADAQKACPNIVLVHVETISEGTEEISEGSHMSLAPDRRTQKACLRRYRQASEEVFAVVQKHAGRCEMASIDEVYLDLSEEVAQRLSGSLDLDQLAAAAVCPNGCMADTRDAHLLAALDVVQRLRDDIFAETGFTVSAGIAESKQVAKLASACRGAQQSADVVLGIIGSRDMPEASLVE
ncbi:DNA polymerase eta (Radiation-sensitive protein 30) (AtRAD30) (Y-family DNA polymerase H) (AtPOLH) [Durusdinium trenchii]|uniref:DNA polymerase eta (Radiation-sensitive protein 30) (AtRAD30) (Y-family DNA polymerase H) (AtPOLH) n=1 Tax=Durusdinium trenchii TaxID=1381693 RepID=A0ABP0RUD5_9DINO